MAKCKTCDGSGYITDVDPKTGKPVRKPCPAHTG